MKVGDYVVWSSCIGYIEQDVSSLMFIWQVVKLHHPDASDHIKIAPLFCEINGKDPLGYWVNRQNLKTDVKQFLKEIAR